MSYRLMMQRMLRLNYFLSQPDDAMRAGIVQHEVNNILNHLPEMDEEMQALILAKLKEVAPNEFMTYDGEIVDVVPG